MTYEQHRILLCELGRRFWEKGWGASNDGNLSVKISENCYLVTPTGVSKGMMTPEMMTVVDEKGKVIEAAPSGHKHTSEFKVHLACYHARPDIGAVIHAHPPVATAYAVAHRPLTGHYIPETMYTLGSVPVVPYAIPGSIELAINIAPYLNEHDALLMANHGALTVGPDLTAAYYMMETVEYCAQLMLLLDQIDKNAKKLPDKEIQNLLNKRASDRDTRRHPGWKEY